MPRIIYLELAHWRLLTLTNESRCRSPNLACQRSLPFLVVVRNFGEVDMRRSRYVAHEVCRVLHLVQILVLLEIGAAEFFEGEAFHRGRLIVKLIPRALSRRVGILEHIGCGHFQISRNHFKY